MKVIILEACDGFTIVLTEEGNIFPKQTHYWFSQEDDKKNLVDVFNRLGFEATYEEDY